MCCKKSEQRTQSKYCRLGRALAISLEREEKRKRLVEMSNNSDKALAGEGFKRDNSAQQKPTPRVAFTKVDLGRDMAGNDQYQSESNASWRFCSFCFCYFAPKSAFGGAVSTSVL